MTTTDGRSLPSRGLRPSVVVHRTGPPLPTRLAEELARLQRLAYAVEARLIDDDRIPALHESASEVAGLPLRWAVAQRGTLPGAGRGEALDSLPPGSAAVLGAVGFQQAVSEGGAAVLDVDRLVVHPAEHRAGIGTALMVQVLAEAARADAVVTVSTAVANHPALALYTRLGFRPDGDIEVVPGLWVRRLVWRQRRAVRILCLDPAGRVLLLRWRDPHDGRLVWEPPGGGVEAGESPLDAARRELVEETGLRVEVEAQGHAVLRDQWWNGRRHVAVESFFVARVPRHQPSLGQRGLRPDEVPIARGHEWVAPEDLSALSGALEPPGLAQVLRELVPGR